MTKTSKEIEQDFMAGLRASTGKDLTGWLSLIESDPHEKRNDIIAWLKKEHSFGHMHASLLAGIYFNDGKPVYASGQKLLDDQFAKYPEMRLLFKALKTAIQGWDKEAQFVAKKTYISITKKREFAAINIKKGELRLGMDLGDAPFKGRLEKAKLSGPMPRISHMLAIRSEEEIGKELKQLLETADRRVNP